MKKLLKVLMICLAILILLSSCATINLNDLPEEQTFKEIDRYENLTPAEDEDYLVEVEYYKIKNAYYKGLAYDNLYNYTTKILKSTEKIYKASRDVLQQAKKIEAKNRVLTGISISLGSILGIVTTYLIIKEIK